MWETTSFRNELTDDLSGVSEAIRSMVAACFVVLRNLVMGYEDRTPGNRIRAADSWRLSGQVLHIGYQPDRATLLVANTAVSSQVLNAVSFWLPHISFQF